MSIREIDNVSGVSGFLSDASSLRPEALEETADLRGPFTVEIAAEPWASRSGAYHYALKVKGVDGEHVVRRRYTRFAEMRDGLAKAHSLLPPMPPKSFFRRQFSSGFRVERLRALGQLLAFLLKHDRFATDPALRSLLGLSEIEAKHGLSQAGLSYMDRLDCIVEVTEVTEVTEALSRGSSASHGDDHLHLDHLTAPIAILIQPLYPQPDHRQLDHAPPERLQL